MTNNIKCPSDLKKGHFLRLRRGESLRLRRGTAWITVDGELEDYVVESGGEFASARGEALLEALTDLQFSQLEYKRGYLPKKGSVPSSF
jgi:hypothetical protein